MFFCLVGAVHGMQQCAVYKDKFANDAKLIVLLVDLLKLGSRISKNVSLSQYYHIEGFGFLLLRVNLNAPETCVAFLGRPYDVDAAHRITPAWILEP